MAKMNIKFECFCGQPIEINSEAGGQQLNCPSCGTVLIVPELKTETQKIPPLPPVIPPPYHFQRQPVAERIKVNGEKNSHSGPITLFFLGLIGCLFCTPIVGGIMIIVAIVWDLSIGTYKSTNYACGKCGNFVSPISQICPTCQILLRDKKSWWSK